MKTITVKVKFKLGSRIKSIKLDLEFPEDKFPCFGELVDEIYSTGDNHKLNEMFNGGYIIGVEQILK